MGEKDEWMEDKGRRMNLSQTCSVWNANINFAIKSSEPPESRIHTVWAVGGSHDNHMSTLFEPIHECQ